MFQYGLLIVENAGAWSERWVFTETGKLDATSLLDALNELGEDSWELACAETERFGRYIMKRKISTDGEII